MPDTTNTKTQIEGALAALAAALGGRALAGNAQSAGQQNIPPQLSQLLQMGVDREAYQNPLFQATTQGVYSMLPTFAKQGTNLSGSLSNVAPQATSGGDGGGMSGAAAGGLGLAGMLTPELIAAIKKLLTDKTLEASGGLPRTEPDGSPSFGGPNQTSLAPIGSDNYAALSGNPTLASAFPQFGGGGGSSGDQLWSGGRQKTF